MIWYNLLRKGLVISLRSLGRQLKSIKIGNGEKDHMTNLEWIKWLGLIILPGAIPILIFLQFARQTIARLTREKTLKIFGNIKVSITEEDINNDLHCR